jgi:hypothetical protein
MKRTMHPAGGFLAASLLLASLCTACSTMDGPEAAAKTNFLEWAGNIRTPYRNETFETISSDAALATVRITVDLMIQGEWMEKQLEIHCEQVDADWQCERSMQFR